MLRDEGEKRKESEQSQPRPWVDQVGFGWRMTCQMIKRIGTGLGAALVASLGIYNGDVALISVLKNKAEKRRRGKWVSKMHEPR